MKDELMKERVAYHEAGHAWGYHRAEIPIRYVTIRPRTPGSLGLVAAVRPEQVDKIVDLLVTAAGPVAEALHEMQRDNDGRPLVSHAVEAAILSGHESEAELLRNGTNVEWVRRQLEPSWEGIEIIAQMLLERGTVPGKEVREVMERYDDPKEIADLIRRMRS